MPQFDITISAVIPAYGTVRIEAKDKREANEAAARIARQGWKDPELPVHFETERDATRNFEVFAVEEQKPPECTTCGEPEPSGGKTPGR